MHVSGLHPAKSPPRFRRPDWSGSTVRDQLTYTAIPAVAATTLAFLLLSLDPAVLLITSLVLALLIGASFLTGRRRGPTTIILVGQSPLCLMLAASLEAHYHPNGVGILRAYQINNAINLVRTSPCDEIVLADSGLTFPQHLVDVRGRPPTIVSGRHKLETLLNRLPLEFVAADHALAHPPHATLEEARYVTAKRIFDVGFALALSLLLLPLLPIAALAIKLTSRGPVLYTQERVGLNGLPFRIYKFRTMIVDAEQSGAVWARANDARVTRIGKYMRKSRMDELPQLWNLIRGDMSLVGPRPERPEFTATLTSQIPAYDLRHTVKPGLTGWAQVSYRYTSTMHDARAKLEYDLYYVKHRSFLLDIKILLRTVGVVLAMKGR